MAVKKVNEELRRVRRSVLVHVILYHVLDSPIIDDFAFDRLVSKVNKLNDTPDGKDEKGPLFKEFESWDGKSGFIMASAVNPKWVDIANGVKRMVDRHRARM